MTGNGVLTNKPSLLRLVWAYRYQLVLYLWVLVFVVFTLLRCYSTYGLNAQARENRRRIDELVQQLQTINHDQNARIESLEQAVFGDIEPKVHDHDKKLETKPARATDKWQMNRDNELRDRIRRLEEWRLQQREPQ